MFRQLHSWQWRGLNRHGLLVRGVAFVPPEVLRTQLWRQGITLQRARFKAQRRFSSKLRLRWQQQFTHDWLTLLDAGIAQLDALQLIFHQCRHAEAHGYLQSMVAAIQRGVDLATALRQCEAGFSSQYCRLVSVGEQSGQLPATLRRLEEQFRWSARQRQDMRKALSYPVLVAIVAILVIVAMLYLIVPQFAQLYSQLQVDIPQSTAYLLDIASWLRQPSNIFRLIVPVVAIWPLRLLAGKLIQRSPTLTRWLYSVPVLGTTLRSHHLLHDLTTLNLAYSSSIPLTEACDMVSRSSGSALFRRSWQRCKQLLTTGSNLYESLNQQPLLDDNLLQHIALGEQSGRLAQQLTFIVQRLQGSVERSWQKLMAALEPGFLLITGALTAVLLLALYLPLFQLGQLVS